VTTGDDATGGPPEQGQHKHQEHEEAPAGGQAPAASRRRQDGVEVLTLSGELDLNSVQDITPLLDEALTAQPGRLVVDLSRVSFADSSALNLLLRTHTRTSLHLCGPLHPFVERLFEVTGILSVLNVHSTVDDAVRAAASHN
jgi:anti-anti-sigma factor